MDAIVASLTPNAIVFLTVLVAVMATATIGFLSAENKPAVFEYLYLLAMVIALANLTFIVVQAVRGALVTTDVVLAIISGAVCAYCLFYGFWGVTEGAEGAEAARRALARQQQLPPKEKGGKALGTTS